MKPKIFIAMPHTGNMRTELVATIMRWQLSGKYEIRYHGLQNVHPVDRARNVLLHRFLESDCDYIFFIDSDMNFQDETIDILLSHDKDMVSGCALRWQMLPDRGHYGIMPMGTVGNQIIFSDDLREVDRSNTNCTLIKRKVIEDVGVGAFKFEYTDDTGIEMSGSEDFVFCDRVRDAGYKVWIDYGLMTSHFKTVDLFEVQKLVSMVAVTPAEQKVIAYSAVIESQFLDGMRWDRALDVGAGTGGFLRLIRNYSKHVTGLDTKRYRQADQYDKFLHKPFEPADTEGYDIVFMLDFIEHLSHDAGTKLLLSINAPIILTTPSKFHDNEDQSILNKNPDEKHLSVWTQDELESLGFKTCTCTNIMFEKTYGREIMAMRS